jgi:DNA-binding Lrp family transcriptional regulator
MTKMAKREQIHAENSTATVNWSPMLAFVDADITSGRDEYAREQLLNNLRDYSSPGVAPLWVNWMRHRADLRFACFVRDVREFNRFMLDMVRSVEGVRQTRTMLSFGGRANIDTLLELEMEVSPNSGIAAASILIDVEPGKDRQCFQALIDLPSHPDVRRVWLLNTYHSEDADLMLLLLGKDVATLTGYVMSWVRTTEGVIDTETSTMLDWRWLASPDDIVEVCEHLFIQSHHLAAFSER